MSRVVLELNDTGQRVTVTKEQPFRRVDGYMVDLKYAPENKTWTNRRVGASLSFNGEEYNIVAITENEVVLSAKSNQKKWTIKYSASACTLNRVSRFAKRNRNHDESSYPLSRVDPFTHRRSGDCRPRRRRRRRRSTKPFTARPTASLLRQKLADARAAQDRSALAVGRQTVR